MLGAASAVNAFAAVPGVRGQSGYINMPNAGVEPDGTFSAGYSFDNPYGSFWATATILPFLQVTGRYVSINGIPGFSNVPGAYGSQYGRFKDKVVDAKLQVLPESTWLPGVAVGATDLFGTELFKGRYLVASKAFGAARNIEASFGIGQKRPTGPFAAARWAPLSVPGLALVAEYDATDYSKDFRAQYTAAGQRRKGPAVGLEYRWGWLGAQVARHREHFSANLWLSIPFSEREFIPKFQEPAPFQSKDAPARVSAQEWQQDRRHAAGLVQALVVQDFKNVRVDYDGATMVIALTNNRISSLGRAVGRAARTALAFAPEGTRAIRVIYTRQEQPVATYEFVDLQRLTDYFTGLVDRDTFLQTVDVRYAGPGDVVSGDSDGMLSAIRDDAQLGVQVNHEGDFVKVASEDRETNRFKLVPKLSFFFNDPSGALRYELWAAANYDRRLAQGLYLNSDLKATVLETVSGVTQSSNSLLPHVRTDIAEYKRAGRVKLNRLMLNQYMTPSERVYLRASAGLYEEMFRGVGGQALYLPKDSRWAADVSVDALQQRGYKGWFDKREYKTVTALGAMHYRLPYDITVTARAGRFLAKDEGVRLEFKRRLASGVEIGAWYTRTNGNDITSPGTPASPYHDKGLFMSVPLNIMLTKDSQATAGMALAPWTRDVGQMVMSPGDLYEMVEQPRRDMTTYDGLGNFAERADEQRLPAVNPPVRGLPNPWQAFRWRVEQSVSTTPSLPEWADGAVVAGAALAAGALLDKPVDRFLQRHGSSSALRAWGNVGKAMPVVMTGAAGAAVLFGDARAQNIGLISLQSVAGAAALSIAAKNMVGRTRPYEADSCLCSAKRSDSSFPSNHSAVAFAAVTPFAKEYDAPWLYGLASVSAMGRVASRQHWVSDVVGGSVIGYAVGNWLWRAQRDDTKSQLVIAPGARELSVAWSGSY
nr:YjbH domain-containing protein [Massilia agilis]